MKISTAKAAAQNKHTIYLFRDPADLKDLKLSAEERNYVIEDVEDRDTKLIRLNRYTEFLYLVYLRPGGNSGAALREKCRIAGNDLLKMLKGQKPQSLLVKNLNSELDAIAFTEGMILGNYRFTKYLSKEKDAVKWPAEIAVSGADKKAVNHLDAVVRGTYTARDLVNEPLNFLTAEQLSKEAVKAGDKFGFKVEVLNKKKIQSLKMGGLLAVNRGSQDPPTFTIMDYQGEEAVNSRPIVLVGKGVVYDTGGLSLKPTPGSMDSMKSDMAGAAAVLGAMIAIAKAKLPLRVIGLMPATDNRPGENAYVPGDIIKMYDGSTVEVLNTDAEGRMILADALSYAQKYDPELVVNLATLTGAAAVAIGKYGVVAMGTAEDREFEQLSVAGSEVYERIARFPFWDEYNELLKSHVADVKNIGGREGGAITAGKFLERFTNYPFIHLDIAGPAFLSSPHEYRPAGGTGVGVRLLFEFLKNRK